MSQDKPSQDKPHPKKAVGRGAGPASEGAELIYSRPVWSEEERALEQAWEDWVTTAAPPMKKSA